MSQRTWLGRAGIALLTTMGTVGLVAAPAQAAATGVAYLSPPTEPGDPIGIIVKAGSGRKNAVVITRSGRTVTIDDRVALRAGKGCKAVKKDKTKVRCTTSEEIGHVGVYLGSGNDKVTNRSDLVLAGYGGAGTDTLIGGPAGDTLFGGTGADRLHGLAGTDNLFGENGNDALSGGAGNDHLMGGTGNDREFGGAGDDSHAQGWDTPFADADLLSGGAGTDLVSYSGREKAITADSDGVQGDDGRRGERDTITGAEFLVAGLGDDRLTGTDGPDHLSGLAGNDTILGNGGNDLLEDYAGLNRLDGGPGDDTLQGGSGTDRLLGGPGTDTLTGAAGDDHLDGAEDGRIDTLDGGDNSDTCLPNIERDTRVNCEK